MHSESVTEALRDMADNIALAISFTGDRDKRQFAGDLRTVYAVVRCLEIVSEASRRIPADIKDEHASIQWREVATAGNIYRHEYHAVLPELIWTTVHDHLPALERAVHALLAARTQD